MSLRNAIIIALVSNTLCCVAAHAEKVVNVLSIDVGNSKQRDYFLDIAKAYSKKTPGVKVDIKFLEDEAFKTKLPTLLQSKARPDAFFSWGGGTFYEQQKAGVLRDISGVIGTKCKDTSSKAGLGAFSREGKLYGMPMYAAQVVFWYNKKLAAKAGIDPTQIKNWKDFLAQVKKAKSANVTPIVVGGKDKWPLHFYYSLLAVRMLGEEGISKAAAGLDGGYANEGFVKVGKEFKRLVDLKPFQPGFMDAKYDKASGLFGDSKGIFHLMGDWDYLTQKSNSTSGKGVLDEDLGIINFPIVEGGTGKNTDTFGAINGWLFSKNASDESVKFLCYMLNVKNQTAGGREGFWIPVAKGADKDIKNQFLKTISKNISVSEYHQLFLDQALGASVGGAVNDVSAAMASGDLTPKAAAEKIEEARQLQ